MPQIEPIYLSTTMIQMLKDDDVTGNATGFFYSRKSDNKLFLITNKHVIYGEKYYKNPEVKINKFRLRLHTNSQNISENSPIEISLFNSDSKKLWDEHSNPQIDVIVLPIEIDRTKFIIAPIDDFLFDCENLVINFEKIFVMGYPYGWYDDLNNLPVTRIGHLSSPFNVDFRGQPIMLGDVETHPGMSGGPVFVWLNDFTSIKDNRRTKHLGQSKIILAGIHSGQPRWDLIDKSTGKIKESISHKLINIWNYRLINEIITNN